MAQLTHDSRSWCRSSSATRCQLLGPGCFLEPLPHDGSEVLLVDDVVAVEHGARALAAQAHGCALRDGSADLAPRKGGIGRRPRLVHGRRWREGDAWSSTHVARSAHRRALLEARSPEGARAATQFQRVRPDPPITPVPRPRPRRRASAGTGARRAGPESLPSRGRSPPEPSPAYAASRASPYSPRASRTTRRCA